MNSANKTSGLTVLELLPIQNGGCGSSCGSSCKTNKAALQFEDSPTLEMAFEDRKLNLSATPSTGSYVSFIDMDLTVECNLRCTYCFKEKWNEHMEEKVAFETIVWLMYASGPKRDVYVNFMGGEPLIRFKLIKKLVPFAKRRAREYGKRIHFGMTTNGTLVSDEVVSFWKEWGMGFHTSIDGTPEIQDQNRPTTGGKGSSRLVERAVPKILAYRPNTTARSTVIPSSVGSLYESYVYFRSLGYNDIAFVPGGPNEWNDVSVALYETEFMKIADAAIEEFRRGNSVHLKGIDDYIEGHKRGSRSKHACGAGRGLLLIDIHGDIWPCHRWNKDKQASWQIGSIYEQFNESVRSILDQPDHTVLLEQDCPKCPAQHFCSGGCPAENLEETGSVYKRHVNSCELTRVWARVGRYFHDVLFNENNRTFMNEYYSR